MKVINKGKNGLVISMTWSEFGSITGVNYNECFYEGSNNIMKLKEFEDFNLEAFVSSVRVARLVVETKDKMVDLLEDCKKNLDEVFFPIQPRDLGKWKCGQRQQ